ncbi:MAG: hypothetical protein D3906_09300 [Candidatus Electrothrix sp. AUS1_2]|nr:hypothetical protein [Candidatus Electrothrix sp. AUS1_2]
MDDPVGIKQADFIREIVPAVVGGQFKGEGCFAVSAFAEQEDAFALSAQGTAVQGDQLFFVDLVDGMAGNDVFQSLAQERGGNCAQLAAPVKGDFPLFPDGEAVGLISAGTAS